MDPVIPDPANRPDNVPAPPFAVGTPVSFISPHDGAAFVIHVSCPLHGAMSLVATTSDGANTAKDSWTTTHSHCTARPRYPAKRRV